MGCVLSEELEHETKMRRADKLSRKNAMFHAIQGNVWDDYVQGNYIHRGVSGEVRER